MPQVGERCVVGEAGAHPAASREGFLSTGAVSELNLCRTRAGSSGYGGCFVTGQITYLHFAANCFRKFFVSMKFFYERKKTHKTAKNGRFLPQKVLTKNLLRHNLKRDDSVWP
jgi:hypothetical protein